MPGFGAPAIKQLLTNYLSDRLFVLHFFEIHIGDFVVTRTFL